MGKIWNYCVPFILESLVMTKLLFWFTDYNISMIVVAFMAFSQLIWAVAVISEEPSIDKNYVSTILTLSIFYIAVIVIVTLSIYGIRFLYCHEFECCSGSWISPNIAGLTVALNKRLYGQHLVIGPVVKHVRGHVEGNPQKPLVLSFHGLPGTGKNFVSTMLAQHLYGRGMHSQYVHYFSAAKDFIHEDKLEEYQEKLKESIEKAAGQCERSLFIIDEMDKMPPGLIGTLKPYLDFNEHVHGVDYRKSTFVFLGNTAGQEIAKKTEDHLDEGFERSKLTLKEMEEIIRLPSYSVQSAFWHSDLIRNSLITAYIPFLPLERRHIEQCIIDGLFSKGYYAYEYQIDREMVGRIADELTYFPEETKQFSATGCKRVLEKIDLIMQPDE